VDNMGETHDHTGRWTDATHFSLHAEGMVDSKPMVEDLTAEIVSKDEYRFTDIQTVDGKEASRIEARMKRTGSGMK